MTSWVLGMLLLRAYVPLGFMPASAAPFLLEICPAGLPGQIAGPHLHHAHHGTGDHGHFDDCPFGSAPAAGPISHVPVVEPAAATAIRPTLAFAPSMRAGPLRRAHQARAPPTPA
jgi:hypothetical protein